MLKNHLILLVVFSASACAADESNNVTLSFSGRVKMPSCSIAFESSVSAFVAFNEVNVS